MMMTTNNSITRSNSSDPNYLIQMSAPIKKSSSILVLSWMFLGGAIFLGVMFAIVEGNALRILLALLAGMAFIGFIFLNPTWGICLLPLSAVLPKTLPRLGEFGYMELSLVFLLGIWMLRFLFIYRYIRVDKFLIWMGIAAVPIVFSVLLGRGPYDLTRLYNWGGSCLAYFLVLNLVVDRKAVYDVVLIFSIIVVGLILADFLFFSGVPLPKTDYEWAVYRSASSTIAGADVSAAQGQANLVVALATLLFPIPVAYGLLNRKSWRFGICLTLIGGNFILAVLVQTRAFILCGVLSLLVMIYFANRRYQFKLKLVFFVILFIIVGIVLVSYFLPGGWIRIIDRFATADETQNGRVAIWLNLIRAGLNHPLLGHGALGYEGMDSIGIRGGHGLFPQIFFEYGIAFVIPVGAILFLWLKRSVYLVLKSKLEPRDFSIALATLGIVAGVFANVIINDHLLLISSYSMLAFALAALQAVQIRINRQQTPAVKITQP